jgi:hypothetical protein
MNQWLKTYHVQLNITSDIYHSNVGSGLALHSYHQEPAKPVCSSVHDPNHKEIRSKSPSIPLTTRSLDLLWRTLSSLLSHDSSSLSLCCTSGTLRLLGFLCALCCSSLFLAFFDCGRAGSGTGFGSLRSSLLDHIERGTDNGTLGLDCTARSLLGNFLLIGDISASDDHPNNIILLEEKLA